MAFPVLLLAVALLVSVANFAVVAWAIRRGGATAAGATHPPGTLVADLGSALLLGLGALTLVLVPLLYRFIHGDRDRYRWIINGPAPFGDFGGGPYQVVLYLGLAVLGSALIAAGVLLRRRVWRRPPSSTP